MPASLHRELVEAAKADKVSLNQFVCALLAGGMRWRQGGDEGRDGTGVTSEREPGSHRVSDEEYERLWRKNFA
jgi:HicB-like protein involved in pilus formation